MGWYCHPDTLTMAQAKGIASNSGFPSESWEYLKAYRDAYEKIANKDFRGLDDFLSRLDKFIEEKKNGS